MTEFNHMIVAWSRKRGLLNNFDPTLQIKLLTEEAREFHMAESFEHRLAEYADFVFVKVGTLAIYECQDRLTPSSFAFNRENFIKLMEWAEETECNMISLLRSEYAALKGEGTNFNFDDESTMRIAVACVVDNNDLKGTEIIDGKVIKGEEYVRPELAIRGLIYAD